MPAHSSHKTEPLDHGIFRSLKAYYDAAVDSWDVSHPAFEKTSTVENAVDSFKATGIFPLDKNVCTDADFLPSEVTDQPPEEEELGDDDRMLIVNNDNIEPEDNVPAVTIAIRQDLPSTAILSVSRAVSTKEVLQQSSSYCVVTETSTDEDAHRIQSATPGDIIPLPKIKIQRKQKRKGLQSQLLTSTPIKDRMEKELAEREEKTAAKEIRSRKRERSAKEIEVPSSKTRFLHFLLKLIIW